jgi:GAF domain-containing protein
MLRGGTRDHDRMSKDLSQVYRELEARSRELTEALQQQSATADILKTISRAAFDLPAVLHDLVATAARLCGATFGGIFLREAENLKGGATIGLEGKDVAEFMDFCLPIDRSSVSGRVVLSGRVVNVPDIGSDAEYDLDSIRKITSVRSMLGVPLSREGKVEGVFFLGRLEPGAFNGRQIELVQTFADQAMIAIANVRLFEETKARTAELAEALQQQTATADVLKAISRSTFNLQAVLNTLVESAARLCNADLAQIFQWDGARLRWSAGFALTPEYLDIQRDREYLPGRDSLVGRVALSRQNTFILDVQADPEYAYKDHAKIVKVRTLLGVPLLRSGELIGVIVLARQRVEPYTDKQVELVTTFADQAVIAIENARLFKEVQARNRELTETLEQQTATSEILGVISSSPTNIQPVFNVLARNAARLSDAHVSAVYTFDGRLVQLVACHGMSEEAFAIARQHFPSPPNRKTAGARAILTGTVIEIPNTEEDPDYVRGVFSLSWRTGVLAVPMLREGVPIGAIAVDRQQVGMFPKRLVDLLKTFADQAVIAIENARLFEEVQARNRELTETLEQQTATSTILRVIAGFTDGHPAGSRCGGRERRTALRGSRLDHFSAGGRSLNLAGSSGSHSTGLVIATNRPRLGDRTSLRRPHTGACSRSDDSRDRVSDEPRGFATAGSPDHSRRAPAARRRSDWSARHSPA